MGAAGAPLSMKALIASIATFEATLTASSARNDSDFEAHRRDAIELRRQIAVHRAEISTLFEQSIASPELRTQFRARFSALCSALALHQASWPVVAIELDNPDYQASRDSTRAKYREFFAWARTALRDR